LVPLELRMTFTRAAARHYGRQQRRKPECNMETDMKNEHQDAEDLREAHLAKMREFASFSDPAGRNLLIKHMGPVNARRIRSERQNISDKAD
jgi:hypothetical protein